MKRSSVRPKRKTPRRRDAPRFDREDWAMANIALNLRANGVCECCTSPLNGRAERHHRIRRRDGGDRISNLMMLLPEHHAHWTEHPAEAIARGIILHSHADPQDCPVLLNGVVWRYLTDSGTMIDAERP